MISELDENWNNIAPFLLDYNNTLPKYQHNKVSQKIRNFYIGYNKRINRYSLLKLIRMIGDRLFYSSNEDILKLISKVNKSPTWFYMYNYRANNSTSDFFIKMKSNYGKILFNY